MPRFSNSKYSTAQTQEMTMHALDVLATYGIPMTISDICAHDITLAGATSQKMSRCLNELVEMGMVRKSQNKRTKRMMYMSVEALLEQGYDLDELVC